MIDTKFLQQMKEEVKNFQGADYAETKQLIAMIEEQNRKLSNVAANVEDINRKIKAGWSEDNYGVVIRYTEQLIKNTLKELKDSLK